MEPVTVKVSPTGRLHLPAEVRRTLSLKGAGQVVITLDDGNIPLSTAAPAVDQARALARSYAPSGCPASHELIAEAPVEAQREEDDGRRRARPLDLPAVMTGRARRRVAKAVDVK